MVLACDVSYDGDAHFEAEVGTSFANDLGFEILSAFWFFMVFDPVFVHESMVLKSHTSVPIGIKNLAFTGPLQIELKDLCGKVSQPEMKT